MLGTAEGLASELLGDACQLEHDTSGLDGGNPPLRSTLTGTHSCFGGLLGQRAVREDVDPDLTATLDVTGHGDTSRLNLTVGDVGGLECLDAVIAERQFGATGGKASAVRTVLLAVLSPTGNEHGAQASDPVVGAAASEAEASRGACCAAVSWLGRPPRRGPRRPSRRPPRWACSACWRANSRSVMSPL